MCGIAGICSQSPINNPDVVATMRATLKHRGPDGEGLWVADDQRAVFAHTRLAIIDLTESGAQPMTLDDGRIVITYNGEIYNFQVLRDELERSGHQFHSSSDTEVILAAYKRWGMDAIGRLQGMFALAIYDREHRRVVLARDKAGQKPLFFRHAGGKLYFASELKALLANPELPRTVNMQALDSYLTYGYVQGDMCLLDGYHKLAPASILTYDLDTDTLETRRYWRLPEPDPDTARSDQDLIAETQHLLRESVRRHLIADVPVGVLLSGGLDSSLVTAYASQVSEQQIKTFTISFPGHGQLNEGPYAKLVADHFGTDHTELEVEPATADILLTLAAQYDEPIADFSIIPTSIVCSLVRQHAKVALGGDGGDELFGGYSHYNFVQSLDAARRVLPRGIRAIAGGVAERYLPPGTRGRNHIIGLAGDLRSSIAHINLLFDARTRAQLVPGLDCRAESIRRDLCNDNWSVLQQATRADYQTTMVDGYLVKVDRASMLHSLEVRCPFLDSDLTDFAFSQVPDRWRATHRGRKLLLRAIGEEVLPKELDLKRKQGFTPPLASWFKGSWGPFLREVMTDSSAGLFDRRTVDELIAGQERGRGNIARLFALTMFELWRREYRIDMPAR
jgi:asparagine synthase (glutamine-hydrolysing)